MSISRKKLIEKVAGILKSHGIKKAGIFGSFARNEQKKGSDIDVLVDFNGSLFKLAGLELELEKALKRKVDLLTYKGINHLLKDIILKEEERIIWQKTQRFS